MKEGDLIFVHYLDRDNEGNEVDIDGKFELVKEEENFIVLKTKKNIVRIPYYRIIKLKEANKI